MTSPAAPSVLDIREGGWVCRAGVYRDGDFDAYEATAGGIVAGLLERAAGHGLGDVDWWTVETGIPVKLRELQGIAGWSDDQVWQCIDAVHRFGARARLLIGVMAVDRGHPENGGAR